MKQSKNMRGHIKDSGELSRLVRLDTNPHEIISTLYLATDGLLSNRSRERKRCEGWLILAAPIFAHTREGGA